MFSNLLFYIYRWATWDQGGEINFLKSPELLESLAGAFSLIQYCFPHSCLAMEVLGIAMCYYHKFTMYVSKGSQT